MTDPQIILDDIARGYSFLSDVIHNEIYAAQVGTPKDDCEIDSQCLLYILRALTFRTEQDKFDSTTEKLWRCLVKIIGTYIAPVLVRFYYGQRDTNDSLTLLEITSAPYIEVQSGIDPIIPYTVGLGPKYNWMAETSTEIIKTKWQDTVVVYNNGTIGLNPDDAFIVPYNINIYRVYINDFPTEYPYPLQFKKN